MAALVLKVHGDYQQLKLIPKKFCAYFKNHSHKYRNKNKKRKNKLNKMNTGETTTAIGAHILPTTSSLTYDIQLKFNKELAANSSDRQLKDLIQEKVQNKEFFYGIEILARNQDAKKILDYNSFGSLMPLFTSIVWLSAEYWKKENLAEIEAIKLARKLQPHTIVLPHFSCYQLKSNRLQEFLNLNFSNVLAIRGDFYEENQTYKYSGDLVQNIRQLRGDTITIGVGGYPEGHPESLSKEDDLNNLFKKVQAGADFIITQICFSPQAVIDFIRNCRAKAIKIPILVGIFIPDNLHMLEAVLRITKINMCGELLAEYRNQSLLGHKNFTEYAVRKAVEMLEIIFSSNEEVYGVQFFTLNKFKNIAKTLNVIQKTTNITKKR